MKLAEKIKEKARQIGFDLVGITSAEPFSRAFNILQKRKIVGRFPEFITDDLRLLTVPSLHLASASSFIAVAMSYVSDMHWQSEVGKISRYARGKDYHAVIKEKLKKLAAYIKNLRGNIRIRIFVDSGTLLEKEVAFRAGLGWIGKNNILINPRLGSYLFLGVLLTDLRLATEQPSVNRCGDCNLCVQSCPALIKPHFLAYDKCISYLTQKKGILPVDDRKRIGLHFWGCDLCQEVCPYNNNIPENLHPEFYPQIPQNPVQVLDFSENKWRETALGWRGLRILKRNILINIGNSGNRRYVDRVRKELHNPSPVLRAYAVWALGELGENKFNAIADREKDERVIAEIERLR